MIAIKALKPNTTRAPSAEEIYRSPEVEGAPSRRPAVFVLALTAVALYLKSLFPGLAKSDLGPPTEDPGVEEAGEGPGRAGAKRRGAAARTRPARSATSPTGPIGSGEHGPAVGGIADFMGIDSPAIDYEQLPLPRFVRAGIDFALGRNRAGNDNLVVVSPGSGSSGAPEGGARGGRNFEDMVNIGSGAGPESPGRRRPVPAGHRHARPGSRAWGR